MIALREFREGFVSRRWIERETRQRIETEARRRVKSGGGEILPADQLLIGNAELLSQPEASGVSSSTSAAYEALNWLKRQTWLWTIEGKFVTWVSSADHALRFMRKQDALRAQLDGSHEGGRGNKKEPR